MLFYYNLTFLEIITTVVADTISSKWYGAVTVDTKRIYIDGHPNGWIAGLAMVVAHSNIGAAVCCHYN